MLAVAALSISGVGVKAIPFGRQLGQVTVGSAVALYFTPAVLTALLSQFGYICIATALAFVVGAVGAFLLIKLTGIDGKSAFFAAIPGGAMEMAVLAEKHGASIPAVALAHSLRTTLVVLIIPFAFAYYGVSGTEFYERPSQPFNQVILWGWLAFGVVMGWLGGKLRINNAYLLFPIFIGGALTANGITLSAVPSWMIDVAQLMFGTTLGVRYERDFLMRYKMFIPAALLNAVIITAFSAVAAVGLAYAAGLPVATVITGTAPGGFGEMIITAKVLALGVPMVVAFHFFRVVLTNAGTHYFWLGIEKYLHRDKPV